MIDKENSPVEWAGLMYELEDAHVHLSTLITEMTNDPSFDETDFRVQLGHVFAHLNRAWYRRNLRQDIAISEWEMASKFPDDLYVIG